MSNLELNIPYKSTILINLGFGKVKFAIFVYTFYNSY
jgi:hypothetical protein